VISDQLNHASIIDSVRLAKTITKCQTAVYRHSDMADLEDKLKAAKLRVSGSSSPTACSRWKATLPSCRTSWPWRESTTRSSRWTTPMRPACSAPRAGHRGALRHAGSGGHHHIDLGQGTGGAAGASRPAPPRWPITSRSAPARSSSPTPSRPPWREAPRAVQHLQRHPELVTRLHDHARYFRERLLALGSSPSSERPPSSR